MNTLLPSKFPGPAKRKGIIVYGNSVKLTCKRVPALLVALFAGIVVASADALSEQRERAIQKLPLATLPWRSVHAVPIQAKPWSSSSLKRELMVPGASLPWLRNPDPETLRTGSYWIQCDVGLAELPWKDRVNQEAVVSTASLPW